MIERRMIQLTPKGLYCKPGQFYIDPHRGVENAVITHAHSDHARRGSARYHCAAQGADLLRARVGKKISVNAVPYGEVFSLNGVRVSFHSAGHILGSAQVRMEWNGEVWVASGDYKRSVDPTCAPFESVPCDVFITEATFGTPSFQWPKENNLGEQIYDWWSRNRSRGVNSVLFAYSLVKAQRILGVLAPLTRKAVYCHTSVMELNDCYLRQGIVLAPTLNLDSLDADARLSGELLLVPQSFLNSEGAKILGDKFETAFASGWMSQEGRRSHGSFDHGFVMSDHADWNDLVQTIVESKAKRVYVQHRGKGALVRHLRGLGIQAFPESELAPKNPDQMNLF